MTLKDSEEILPLLDRTKKKEDDILHTQYQALKHFKKIKGGILSKQLLDDNGISSFSEESNQDNPTTSFPGVEEKEISSQPYIREFFDQSITYRWNHLNVQSIVVRKKSLFPWKRNRYHAEGGKHILKNVSGVAHPGEILAIMGSSGAGKSTLLNALTFQSTGLSIKGFRYLNNRPVNNKSDVAQLSAYVEQDNLFIGTLTVKEHLIFQSLVRMDRNMSYRQKLRRVEEVVSELGLEKCQDTVIGYPGRIKGISGGEMKRLSLASEVLTNPPLMFCDEPTSGLDSFIALNVITVLKSMAIRGKTVICTIHQPSSEIFSLFDKILLLAEGRTAFLGRPKEATSFFTELGASPIANYNPADFFIQLLAVVPNQEQNCKRMIKIVCDSYEQSPLGLEISSQVDSFSGYQDEQNVNRPHRYDSATEFGRYQEYKYPASWFLQFRALFWRSWINIIKEPLLVKVRLFQTVVLSLVVGLIYNQQKLDEDGVMNINGVLFTFLTNMTFQNLFGVISVFCSELPIFLKEHSNNLYRTDVYFLSKTFAEIPLFLAIPIVFISITYFWINLNPKLDHFLIATAILALVTNVATSFGYFISCISTNVVMALSIGPPVIIPFLLFGGFLLNLGAIPAYFNWLSYLSWFKYGNEALLINQWSDIDKIECKRLNSTCPSSGEIILNIYHFQKENLFKDMASLFILILFFRLLAFSALVLRTWRYQG